MTRRYSASVRHRPATGHRKKADVQVTERVHRLWAGIIGSGLWAGQRVQLEGEMAMPAVRGLGTQPSDPFWNKKFKPTERHSLQPTTTYSSLAGLALE